MDTTDNKTGFRDKSYDSQRKGGSSYDKEEEQQRLYKRGKKQADADRFKRRQSQVVEGDNSGHELYDERNSPLPQLRRGVSDPSDKSPLNFEDLSFSNAITTPVLNEPNDIEHWKGPSGDRTPLHDAVRSGSWRADQIITQLIDRGADVNATGKDGRTPLHDAARSGSQDAVQIITQLVDRGADVNVADKDGRTPLHNTIQSGSWCAGQIVTQLVDRGADVNAADKDGRTPLHDAAQSGSKNAVQIITQLVDRGADVNAADKDGRTPLHDALRSGWKYADEVIIRLVDSGADVNTADKDGRTPLHDAARSVVWSANMIVTKLINSGAQVNAADMEGRTPLDEAVIDSPRYFTLWENSSTSRHCDTIREVVNEISSAPSHVNCHSILWEWESPAMLNVDAKNDLLLMCTSSRNELVGNLERVRGIIYKECLEQYRWADFVIQLLDLLNEAKLDSMHDGFSICAMKDPRVSITCTHANLSIDFGDKRNCLAAVDLIEVLDWLCRSLRTPPTEGGYFISSTEYRMERYISTESMPHAFFGTRRCALRPSVTLKTSPLPDVEHSCWLSLFDSCLIVHTPSTPHDEFGKGLESSFDLMIALAAAEVCLTINNGLVFVGYQTVLYPVAIDRDSNCAQFHLITSTEGQINPYTLDLKNALRTDDFSQFKAMRCFIGWCEMAHINLGTGRLPTKVGYSGGREKSKSLESDGYAILGQLGASSPLSAVMGLQKNIRCNRHRIHFTPTEGYLKLLLDTSQQSVVLYDAKHQRGWLVPKLSVLLYMSQIYASRFTAVSNSQVPYVEQHTDALQIITSLNPLGETCVFAGGTDQLLFRELLLTLSINLLSTAEALRKSDRKKLYGFEFMDIVHEPSGGLCMKELEIPSERKTWLDLVNAVGTVIVCSELGEVISAAEGDMRKSSTCNRLPRNRDYLAATLPCLSRLAEQTGVDLRAGCCDIKIAEKAIWKLAENSFAPCTHEETSARSCWDRPGSVQQVARLRSFGLSTSNGSSKTRPRQSFPTNGAVVFG